MNSETSHHKEIDDGYELRPKMAEKLLRFLDIAKNITALEGRSLEEVMGNEASRRQFIKNLSSTDYQQLLVGINGIMRNLKQEQWKMDGETVVMGNPDNPQWEFPKFEDKADVLALSLEAAQQMIKDGRDIRDVGLLLSSTITAVHPFNDGNGRTSKFILAMINKGYKKGHTETYEHLLSSTSENHGNLTNTSFIDGQLIYVLQKELGIPEEQEIPNFFVPRTSLSNEHLDMNFRLHKRYVELLIDCIANPEKNEYKVESTDGTKGINLLNFYKQQIKNYTDPQIYSEVFDN